MKDKEAHSEPGKEKVGVANITSAGSADNVMGREKDSEKSESRQEN